MDNESSQDHASPTGVGYGDPAGGHPVTSGASADPAPVITVVPAEDLLGGVDEVSPRERLRRLAGLARVEARLAVLVTLAVAALGVPLGLLWMSIAPRVELVLTSGGWYPVAEEPEGFVAGDGWFAILGAGAGLLVAVLLWQVVRRRRGPAMVLALAAGSIISGLLAAWVGHQLGLGGYLRQVRSAHLGEAVYRHAELRTRSMVLVQAFVGVAVYTLLAAFHYDPSLRSGAGDPAGASQPQPSGEPGEAGEPSDDASGDPDHATGPDGVAGEPAGTA